MQRWPAGHGRQCGAPGGECVPGLHRRNVSPRTCAKRRVPHKPTPWAYGVPRWRRHLGTRSQPGRHGKQPGHRRRRYPGRRVPRRASPRAGTPGQADRRCISARRQRSTTLGGISLQQDCRREDSTRQRDRDHRQCRSSLRQSRAGMRRMSSAAHSRAPQQGSARALALGRDIATPQGKRRRPWRCQHSRGRLRTRRAPRPHVGRRTPRGTLHSLHAPQARKHPRRTALVRCLCVRRRRPRGRGGSAPLQRVCNGRARRPWACQRRHGTRSLLCTRCSWFRPRANAPPGGRTRAPLPATRTGGQRGTAGM